MSQTNSRRDGASLRARRLTYAALYLAIAMVLPFITGQIPDIGKALSPMHIPVLLCGFMCGWPWGLVVGFIAPLMRSVLFGMPALFPDAVSMAFELAVYGGLSGFLRSFADRLQPWDARHYVDIIENGYVAEGDASLFIVFFPLYPMICRCVTFMTGFSAYGVATAVSNAALIGCGAAIYRLML